MEEQNRINELLNELLNIIPKEEYEMLKEVEDFDDELKRLQEKSTGPKKSGIYEISVEDYFKLQEFKYIAYNSLPNKASYLISSIRKKYNERYLAILKELCEILENTDLSSVELGLYRGFDTENSLNRLILKYGSKNS